MAACVCSLDKWIDMSMADVRAMEDVRPAAGRRGRGHSLRISPSPSPSSSRRSNAAPPLRWSSTCVSRRRPWESRTWATCATRRQPRLRRQRQLLTRRLLRRRGRLEEVRRRPSEAGRCTLRVEGRCPRIEVARERNLWTETIGSSRPCTIGIPPRRESVSGFCCCALQVRLRASSRLRE